MLVISDISFIKNYYIYTFVCVHLCIYWGGDAHAMVCVYRSNAKLWESVLSFLNMGPRLNSGHQAWGQVPLPTEPSYQPNMKFLIKICPKT